MILARGLLRATTLPCISKQIFVSSSSSWIKGISPSRLISTGDRGRQPNRGTSPTKVLAYFSALAISVAGLYFVLHQPKVDHDKGPLLRIDLNQVYEQAAATFLASSDRNARNAIKVTSADSDEIRTLNLKREGSQVSALIAYNVQGSVNSGSVFCRLIMNDDNQTFTIKSIYLKLNKPDKKKRIEIPILLSQSETEAVKSKIKESKNQSK